MAWFSSLSNLIRFDTFHTVGQQYAVSSYRHSCVLISKEQTCGVEKQVGCRGRQPGDSELTRSMVMPAKVTAPIGELTRGGISEGHAIGIELYGWLFCFLQTRSVYNIFHLVRSFNVVELSLTKRCLEFQELRSSSFPMKEQLTLIGASEAPFYFPPNQNYLHLQIWFNKWMF